MGQAEEITLPDVTVKMAEHKTLGLLGTLEFPSGFDKMAGKVKWSSYYPDTLKKTANPFNFLQLQVRGSVENWNGQQGRAGQVPFVAMMTVGFKKLPGGAIKPNDSVEVESEYTCYYFKLTIGGEDIVEFDVMANVYKAGGQDLLTEYKANIGG